MIQRRTAMAWLAGAASATGAAPRAVLAADVFPSRAVTLVVPFAAGGTTDLLGRAMAVGLAKAFGSPVVVENRPGGGTTVAAQRVASAAADGHTVLLASTSTLVIHPLLNPNPGFDAHRDFAGVSMVGVAPMVLVVNARSPYYSVADLVAAAGARPGQLNYGSPGHGTSLHIAAELLCAEAGIECMHVPYRGSPPALQALLVNEIQFYFDLIPSAKPFIESGQLRALAVTHAARLAALPVVPTLAEQGWRGFNASARFALVVPAGTPRAAIETLNREVVRLLQAHDFTSRFAALGLEPLPSAPKAVLQQFDQDRVAWGPLLRGRNIRLDG